MLGDPFQSMHPASQQLGNQIAARQQMARQQWLGVSEGALAAALRANSYCPPIKEQMESDLRLYLEDWDKTEE